MGGSLDFFMEDGPLICVGCFGEGGRWIREKVILDGVADWLKKMANFVSGIAVVVLVLDGD